MQSHAPACCEEPRRSYACTEQAEVASGAGCRTAPPLETYAGTFPTCPAAKNGSTHGKHEGTVTKHFPFLS